MATNYGSGSLGAWQGNVPVVSGPTQIASAIATGGAFVFGDSISVENGGALATALYAATGQTIAIHAWSGRPTAPAVDQLAAWVAQYGCPPVVVMAVGTNDIFDPPVMAAQVKRVFEIVPPTTKVVWVTTYVSRWNLGHQYGSAAYFMARESDLRNTGWVNAQIQNGVGKHPRGVVADWYEGLCLNPGYCLTYYLRDGVHTTALGKNAWVSTVVAATQRANALPTC